MPFLEPSSLTVTVTAQDIAASEVQALNLANNVYVNSLSKALKRLGDNKLLPGMENDTTHQSCVYFAETQLQLQNGQLVSLANVGVCSAVYSADAATALIVALENVSGIKPAAPYTVTLSKS